MSEAFIPRDEMTALQAEFINTEKLLWLYYKKVGFRELKKDFLELTPVDNWSSDWLSINTFRIISQMYHQRVYYRMKERVRKYYQRHAKWIEAT